MCQFTQLHCCILSVFSFFFFSLFLSGYVTHYSCLLAFKSSPAKKPSGPLPMDPVNVEEGSKLPPQLLELCSEVRVSFL